ncbi:MAG: hypothetical protein ACKV22_03195 [Bryobacteraceae bacterium]
MTLTLELAPEIERSLAAQAQAQGVSLDAYLQGVIEDLARAGGAPMASLEEFRATLDALAEMGRNLPHLSVAALTRESIYQDRN